MPKVFVNAPIEPRPKVQTWEQVVPPGLWVQALCIGLNEYKHWPHLKNGISDAEGIAQSIETLPASKVLPVCQNPRTKLELQTAVSNFLAQIDKHSPPRIVLVFFAGHGIQEGDEIFLLPAAADPTTREQLKKQCLSHDELFRELKKGLDEKIQVNDVVYLVMIDACRTALGGKEPVAEGFSAEIHEPRAEKRPKHWVLCTSASRRDTARDGDDGHSPFTNEILGDMCGLFRRNVQLEHALKTAIQRLEAQGEHPCLMSANNIPESLCLHRIEVCTHTRENVDVFLCFHGGGLDRALAGKMRDKLRTYHVGESDTLQRPIKVFFEAGPSPPSVMEQVSNALHSSSVILLLVSHSTFEDVSELQGESAADDRLARLLCRLEMILEIFEVGQHISVIPLLIGTKTEKILGRSEYESFDEELDAEKFWATGNAPDIAVTSIVKKALCGLRCNPQTAHKLDTKMLATLHETPSILRGRSVRQTLCSLRCRDNFEPWTLQGPEDGALDEICRRIHLLLLQHACNKSSAQHVQEHVAPAAPQVGDKRSRDMSADSAMLTEDQNEPGLKVVRLSECESSNHPHHVSHPQPHCVVGAGEVKTRSTFALDVRGGASSSIARGCPELVGSDVSMFKHDVFISHNWGVDEHGRDNHERAKRLNEGLQRAGFTTWFDEEKMRGNIRQQMAVGIESSVVVLVCVTLKYMQKIAQTDNPDDNCKLEFDYAAYCRGVSNMVPVVMEENMAGSTKWHGNLGFTLGSQLYYKLTSDLADDFQKSVESVATTIRQKLRPEQVLWNQQDVIASHFDSSPPSPSSDDVSEICTIPGSPLSDDDEQILSVHVHNDVTKFREDMKGVLEDFLSLHSRQPKHDKFKFCEMLLVAFMRDKMALAGDSGVFDNLEYWQEKCEDPSENLIEHFHDMMTELNPSVLHEIGYRFAEGGKDNSSSVYVIDWMVQHSPWQLAVMKRKDWMKHVVKQCFEALDTETTDTFLARSEAFLQKSVNGTSWGGKILGKVIETQSYVVFFRVDSLSALVLREQWDLQKTRHRRQVAHTSSAHDSCVSSQPAQHPHEDHSSDSPLPSSPTTFPFTISSVVSSRNWHLCWGVGMSLPNLSLAQVRAIKSGLHVLARLPFQLLNAHVNSFTHTECVQVRLKLSHSSTARAGSGEEESGRMLEGVPQRQVPLPIECILEHVCTHYGYPELLLSYGMVCKTWQTALWANVRLIRCLKFGTVIAKNVSVGIAMTALLNVSSKNLQFLDVSGCSILSGNDTENLLRRLYSTCPGIVEVNMTGCQNEAILRAVAVSFARLHANVHGQETDVVNLAMLLKGMAAHADESSLNSTAQSQRVDKPSSSTVERSMLESQSAHQKQEERAFSKEQVLMPPQQQRAEDSMPRLEFAALCHALASATPRLQFDDDPVPHDDALIQAAKSGGALDVALLLHVAFSGVEEERSGVDTHNSSREQVAFDCNVQEKDGKYALHYAAEGGDVRMAHLLLNAGACVDAVSHLGTTPLMSACLEGRVQLVDCLLRHAADAAAVRKVDGCTPLAASLYACAHAVVGSAECVGLVLRHQSGVNRCDVLETSDDPILALAKAACDIQKVSSWLSSGLDVRALQTEVGCLVLCCQRLDDGLDGAKSRAGMVSGFACARAHTYARPHAPTYGEIACDVRQLQLFLNRHVECLANEKLPDMVATFLSLVLQEPAVALFGMWQTHPLMASVGTIPPCNPEEAASPTAPLAYVWNTESPIQTLCFSPVDCVVAYACENMVVVRDAVSGVVVRELPGHLDSVCAVAFSSDGCLLASASEDKTIRLWNVHTGAQPLRIDRQRLLARNSGKLCDVAWRRDSKMVAGGSRFQMGIRGGVEIWDVEKGTLHSTLESKSEDARSSACVLFHPVDLAVVICCSDDNAITVWNIDTRAVIFRLEGHSSIVNSLALSPDSNTIVSGSADKSIRLWDYSTGLQIGEPLQGHTGSISKVAFSPDGGKLASASWDKSIMLWDSKTWNRIGKPLRCHVRWIYCASFSPDGTMIATSGAESTIQLRDTAMWFVDS